MALSGKRVVFVGDSHLDWSQFGVRLAEKFRQAGADVRNMAVGGSSARSWASGSPVCRTIGGGTKCVTVEQVRTAGPHDLAIISLGTNDAANASAAGADRAAAAVQTAERVRSLARQIGAQQTWLVGPPRTQPSNAHYADENMIPVVNAFRSAFGDGREILFVDSREVPRIDGDGIHVGPRGGEAWATHVFQRVRAGTPTPGPQALTLAFPMATVASALVALGAFVWWLRRRRRRS